FGAGGRVPEPDHPVLPHGGQEPAVGGKATEVTWPPWRRRSVPRRANAPGGREAPGAVGGACSPPPGRSGAAACRCTKPGRDTPTMRAVENALIGLLHE